MDLLHVFGWFLLALTLASLLLISFYAYVHFSHSLDKEYRGGWLGRTLIVIGMALPFAIAALLEFDFMSHYREKGMAFGFRFSMDGAWIPIMFGCLLLCLAMFFFIQYYRNDKSASVKRKLIWASFVTLWPVAAYAIVTANYFVARSLSSYNLEYAILEDSAFVASEASIDVRAPLLKIVKSVQFDVQKRAMVISPFLCMSSLLFVVFGGAGLAFFPVSLIKTYLNRPRAVTAEGLVFQKNVLRDESKKLLEQAKEVFDLRRELLLSSDMEQSELRTKKKVISHTSSALISQVLDFEDTYYSYLEDVEALDTNPLYYTGALVLGILGAIASLLFCAEQVTLMFGYGSLYDRLFSLIKRVSLVYCLLFFMALCAYVCAATTKGACNISRITFFVYQAFPVKPNRTWTDAFLLNNILLVMSMVGFAVYIMHTCPQFSSYLSFALMVKNVMRNPLMMFFYEYKVLRLLFLFSFVLAAFCSLLISSSKEVLQRHGQSAKKQYDKKKADFLLMNKEVLFM